MSHGFRAVRLGVNGGSTNVLGSVYGPDELPELLRRVADWYDKHPEDCAELFEPQVRAGGPAPLTDPFAANVPTDVS